MAEIEMHGHNSGQATLSNKVNDAHVRDNSSFYYIEIVHPKD